MGRFFSLDSPLMAALSRMADLMILNIIVLFMCIPVITIGPTITAMHCVLLKMVRKEEGYIIAPFFKSFKQNFKQTSISGLIIIFIVIVFIVDLQIINGLELSFTNWLRVALLACGIIGVMTLMYVFPLFARFNNTIRGTFKNALFMSILNLPRTILMILACLLPVVLVALNISMFPIIFLAGITGPGYLCAMLYSKTFKRFEPEEAAIDADSWSVSIADDSEIE
ncbi:MAG: DUF624 domain-containing protein [Lachnospiraceae bacterium]|nr:DUF624 domain-containing protein [Lachnospiraceae bacterium]